MEKGKDVFVTGTAPSKDWFLQFLVNQANKTQFELDITLTVGGFLIAGTLVGVRQYFDDLGAYFASPFETTGANPEEVKRVFKNIGDQCSCVTPSEKTETPSYIHLKNVRFFNSQGQSIPGNTGTWWRGRLSEVQGFTPGRLFLWECSIFCVKGDFFQPATGESGSWGQFREWAFKHARRRI